MKRSKIIAVRLTEDEHKKFQRCAEKEKRTLASWIRWILGQSAEAGK